METIFQNIMGYLDALDWGYIITFILICYGVNHAGCKRWVVHGLGITIKTRYRVLLVGILYGLFIFIIRGYTLMDIEILIQSFVFAMVFHKLILETLTERLFPKKEKPTHQQHYL